MISSINPIYMQSTEGLSKEVQNQQLKEVASEFEAVMTSSLLKEGLQSAKKINDDEKKDTYQEFAYEQLAYHVGKQGVLGVSKQLTTQLQQLMGGGANV